MLRQSLCTLALLAGVATFGTAPAFAQVTENTTQPEPPPNPRFPTPRADAADIDEPDIPGDSPPASLPPAVDQTPASLPPAIASPRLARAAETTEVAGRIQKIDDLRLTIDPSVKELEDLKFVIAPEAEIFLNQEPVELDALELGDYVRLTLSNEVRGVVTRVWAARVIDDPDPPPADGTNYPNQPARRADPIPPDPTRQGSLGVVLADSPNEGVLVVNVDQDGPAGSVGLAIGDYLMGLDRRTVMTPEDAIATLMRYPPRTRVLMTVWRQGKVVGQPVVLGNQQAYPDQIAEDVRPYLMAATRMEADPQILTNLGLQVTDTDAGPQIIAVGQESPAERVTLAKGDVIIGIDGVRTKNTAELLEAIRKQPANNNLTFTVLRDGQQKNLSLRLDKPPVSGPNVPADNSSGAASQGTQGGQGGNAGASARQ